MMARISGALVLLQLLFATILLPVAFAQSTTIIPNDLPACAKSCAVLTTAQTNCQAQGSNAKTCFCGSSAAVGNKASGNVCSPECSTSDYATIQSWYANYCASSNANAGSGNQATAASGSQQTSSTSEQGVTQVQTGSLWWHDHWKWVLMVIILAVGFTIIGVGGTIYYRRRRRRLDGELDPRPAMTDWAPSRQSVHDIAGSSALAGGATRGGPGRDPMPEVPPAASGSKGKQRDSTSPRPERMSSGKRLQKTASRIV